MNLKFEKLDELPITSRGKYSPIVEQIVEAEVGQWIKVSGFDERKFRERAIANLNSGKRSIAQVLKKDGLRLRIRRDADDLTFYVRKIYKDEL